MAYKILENNGVDNENIDGAALNNFSAGNRDGIIGGVLNECALAVVGNVLSVSTGCLLLHGVRVKITTPETLSMSSSPTTDTRYQIIAQITLSSEKEVAFTLFVQPITPLIQEDLFVEGFGTYQVELGRFTHDTNGNIVDLTRTADVIYGGGSGAVDIEIGDVTTTTLSSGIAAEVDIDKRHESGKDYLDFKFALPSTAGTAVNINGVQQSNINFDGDPQTQLNSKAQQTDLQNHVNNGSIHVTLANKNAWNAKQSPLTFDHTPTPSSSNPVTSGGVFSALANKAPGYSLSDPLNITRTSGTHYHLAVSVSGTISGTATVILTHCAGTVTISGNSAQIYAVNCPNLTINGVTAANWRNVFRDGRAEYIARSSSLNLIEGSSQVVATNVTVGDNILIQLSNEDGTNKIRFDNIASGYTNSVGIIYNATYAPFIVWSQLEGTNYKMWYNNPPGGSAGTIIVANIVLERFN